MAFFNFYMLLGALGVSIPIIIHILNRKSAKRVMWGAMRFLRDSLVSRRRKILLEEILLMCLRCLLITLLALVAARPFITPGSQVSWLVVLPLILIAIAAFAASFVLWPYPRWRRRLFLLALLMLAGAAVSLIFEERLQARIFATRGARDIALIIDASDSMALEINGLSNFERALEEVESLVRTAPPGSAFSLIVGGSMPYAPVANPLSDREEILAAIADIEPEKGLLRAPDALALAAYTLARGNNLAKQIIIVGDGRREGWNLAEGRGDWEAVKESLEQLPSNPPVILRRLGLPDSIRNAAISDISFSRQTIGLDRPVEIRVTIANQGTETITPGSVQLTVEDASYLNQELGQMPPNTTRTVIFEHRFQKLGAHVVEAELSVDDDLAADNRAWRIAIPVSHLEVLIVDGNPSSRFFERAAAFAALALAPAPETRRRLDLTETRDNETARFERLLVHPRIVDAADFPRIDSLDPYAAIILADVPRLPADSAAALARYVKAGGGLLVAHGPRTRQDFYNQWRLDEQPVMPGHLEQQLFPALPRDRDEDGVSPAAHTFVHPALAMFREESLDLPQVLMRSYWQILPPKDEVGGKSTLVGAALNNKHPLLLDRTLGEGRVLQLACSLDPRDSNLPSSQAFVLIMHQLVYHLAETGLASLNSPAQPGANLSLSRLIPNTAREDRRQLISQIGDKGRVLNVIDRAGNLKRGRLHVAENENDRPGADQRELLLQIPPNLSPGVHRLEIPEAMRPPLAQILDQQDQLPFALTRRGDEGSIQPLNERDSGRLRRYLLWQEALSEEQLLSALEGARFGRELWRPLALAALLLLLGEIAISRWIAVRRRTGRSLKVEFQDRNQPRESFRKHLDQLKRNTTSP